MSIYSIGRTKTVTIDVGLFEESAEYKNWMTRLLENPFKSDEPNILQHLKAISDFWTQGKTSKLYGFSDFVYEVKCIGVILKPTARSCVLSAVKDDNIGDEHLMDEADRIDTIMSNVKGLRAYTVKAEDAGNMNIDFDNYPMVRLTMVKREQR